VRLSLHARTRRWLDRWRPIRPILLTEATALMGVGAILPVLPLYVAEQGIDPATVGIILAAWPAARLLTEPIFGYLADRTSRKPFLVGGVLLMAIFAVLPLAFTSAVELLVLRFLYGMAVAMYEPAARGVLVDSTEEGERGEVFGLFSAAGMAGLVLGPLIGSFGTASVGGYGFPFAFNGVTHAAAGIYLYLALRERPLRRGTRTPAPPLPESSYAEYGADSADLVARAAARLERDRASDVVPARVPEAHAPHVPDAGAPQQAPLGALLNRAFLGAVILNFGLYFSVGVYEVVWSLYMRRLGASIEWIGFTFTLFGLPVLLLGPVAGRFVDRVGPIPFAALGGLSVCLTGYAYTLASEPLLPALFVPIESAGWAFAGPALFAILASGTPVGRSSTAQGLFGSAGTLAFVIASSAAGALFAIDPRYPFYFFILVMLAAVALGVALVRGHDGMRGQSRPRPAEVAAGE
jgi:MFS family permease